MTDKTFYHTTKFFRIFLQEREGRDTRSDYKAYTSTRVDPGQPCACDLNVIEKTNFTSTCCPQAHPFCQDWSLTSLTTVWAAGHHPPPGLNARPAGATQTPDQSLLMLARFLDKWCFFSCVDTVIELKSVTSQHGGEAAALFGLQVERGDPTAALHALLDQRDATAALLHG